MNVALGAVIIFILLIPPISFYVSYSFGRQAKAGPKFTLLDGVLASAIFSLFIHSLAITIIRKEIRFDILIKLVGGELKDVENKITNADFTACLKQFALYNLVIFTFSVLLGRLTRYLVLRWDIHWNNELLRLNNKWWYLFNGYYLTEIGYERREYDFVFVDAVMDSHDGTMIYSGYLIDIVCVGEDLDRIYLNETIRREWKRSQVDEKGGGQLVNNPGEPVVIPGEFFSIAYKEIKNLNIRFITLDNTLEDIEGLPDDMNPLQEGNTDEGSIDLDAVL